MGFASLRSAPLRFALLRSVPVRSALRRFAMRRFVSRRSARGGPAGPGFFPPLIPRLDSFLQLREMFGIRQDACREAVW